MAKEIDSDLHRFESGTRPFPPSPKTTLKDALADLGSRVIERRPYQRTRKQADDAKIVSDRIGQ